jgi:ParB family chromosome partitioning protein
LTRERRLGRGLEALLGRVAGAGAPSASSPTTESPPADSPALEPPAPAGPEIEESPPIGEPVDTASEASQDTPDDPSRETEPASFPASDPSPGDTPTADRASVEASPPEPSVDSTGPGPIKIDVHQIESNPYQPRQDFDPAEIQSLSDSLRVHGLLQPLVVRLVDGRYQLIAGERRLQAAAQAGWTEVPVQVIEADDREVAELAIVENLQRKDLNPLEKASSFQRYLQQYGGTQEELAARLQLDRSTIANLIRLLELPEPVQEAIRQGKITQGHARSLLPLGDEREQIEFCQRIEREGLSVRRTESLVHESIEEADAEPLGVVREDGTTVRPRRLRSDHLAALEEEFRMALGTRVKITHTSRGRGKVVIQFASHEEFERLRGHLCDPGESYPQGQVG